MRIVQLTEESHQLRDLLAQIAGDADAAVIVKNEGHDAVLMSSEHYSSLMETLYLLGSPANAAHLARSIEEVRKGNVHERQLISPEPEDSSDAQHPVLK